MQKWLIVVVSSLLLPCVARAQDELIKDFSSKHLEKFIRDDLKKEFKINKTFGYDISDTSYYALIDEKAKVAFFFMFDDKDNYAKPITAEMLNSWNKKAAYSRAYFDDVNKKTMIRMEGSFDVSGGVTRNQLKSFYANLNAEIDRLRADFGEFKVKAPQEKKQPNADKSVPPAKGQPSAEVLRQGFPHDAGDANTVNLDKHDTGWEIEWDFVPFKVPGRPGESPGRPGEYYFFRIAKATFKWKDSDGAHKSLVVLRNLYLAEAFTEYDDKFTCWLDIAKVGIPRMPASEKYLGPTCVGAGRVLPSKNPDFANKVHQELHYDGLRWMSIYDRKGNEPFRARKGEKLVLWSAIHSGNYAYLMEYNFTDDGRIVSRLGFTAHNFFDREKLAKKKNPYSHRFDGGDVHPHIGCWRFDFDLSDPDNNEGGPKHNELSIVRRVFDPNKVLYVYDDEKTGGPHVYDKQGKAIEKKVKGGFVVESVPFPGSPKQKAAREGKAKWIAEDFTTLRAESLKVTNKNKKRIAYDLISTRTGAAKLVGNLMNAESTNIDFVNYDFWVTTTPKGLKHYYQVPELAKEEAEIKGQPTTVWHSVAGLHVPRDEDFGPGGVNAFNGVALTEWISFTLRPRNLFDSTPFYAPVK